MENFFAADQPQADAILWRRWLRDKKELHDHDLNCMYFRKKKRRCIFLSHAPQESSVRDEQYMWQEVKHGYPKDLTAEYDTPPRSTRVVGFPVLLSYSTTSSSKMTHLFEFHPTDILRRKKGDTTTGETDARGRSYCGRILAIYRIYSNINRTLFSFFRAQKSWCG